MLASRLQFARTYATKVSSKDAASKISSLSVKVHAGSRYATKDGIAHLLSRFNFEDTANKSALRLVRESELLGGSFKSSVDRESITLKAVFLKEDLPYFVNAIGNVLHKPSFKEYQLNESVFPVANVDTAARELCPLKKAEDVLYSITFRNGLGAPIYYDGVVPVSLEDLKKYAEKVYTKENIEVVGEGINEADLKRFVDDSLISALPTGQSLKNDVTPKFHLGETARERFTGANSVAAISVPVTPKDFATFEVLTQYLKSPLYEHFELVSDAKFDSYSGAGLFSLYVQGTNATKVSKNIKTIVSSLNSGKDISGAKSLTSTVLALRETPLSLDSVKNFKLEKFNYAAVGKVSSLPYADEL